MEVHSPYRFLIVIKAIRQQFQVLAISPLYIVANIYGKLCYLCNCLQFPDRRSLSERCVFHTALQVFKIVKISAPYLHDTFAFAVDFTGRSGRNQHRLFVP